jgi:heme oxygenase
MDIFIYTFFFEKLQKRTMEAPPPPPPPSSSSVAASCPAFVEGCPYKEPLGDAEARARAAQCPAFKDGCPFRDRVDVAGLAELLATIPPSHDRPALTAIIRSIHERSQSVKEHVVGSACPVFSAECPFKNLTSAGTPLVAELEYRTWSVAGLDDAGGDADGDADGDASPEPAAAALTSAASPASSTLSKDLKDGTRKSHRAAESVSFVRNFIRGKIDREVYQHMVLSLWHVYTALEAALRRHAAHPVLVGLHFPEKLERKDSLEEDLAYYFGDQWRTHEFVVSAPSACTQDYVDRIRALGKEQPALLLAHAYTRYMGDLSGGQVLMRSAKKAMRLPADGQGTSFYRFPLIPSARRFKNVYRAKLDATPVDSALADKLVAEANLAFVLNMRIFEELDVRAGDAQQVRTLEQVLSTLKMPVRKDAKCPFASLGGPNPHAKEKKKTQKNTTESDIVEKHCPFPFILLHDPVRGVQDPLFFISVVVCVVSLWYSR